jgi:hypothetical protein
VKKIQFPTLARDPGGDQGVVLGPELPAIPERLLLAHAEGRVLLIAGAGVSMQSPSCLPDFGHLVKRVFAQLDRAIKAHLDAQGDTGTEQAEQRSLPLLVLRLIRTVQAVC